jgi:tetratricopeptide (TPR) repeat protein
MTKKQITKEFLQLFSKDWDDPTAHQGFKQLRERVAGQGQWPAIIDARLMAIEKKTAESIKLLKDIVTRDPGNFYASLMLARILCRDNGKPEDALSIYDSLLSQGFQDQPLPDWLEALTLYHKGVALGEMGKSEEEIRIYDDVVKRFGKSPDLPLQEQVATALANKAIAVGNMGEQEEAIRICDDVVKRFGESAELPFREQVATALVNKGVLL